MTLTLNPEPDLVYYLAGPMTGYEEFNYPAFERAATTLRAAGFEIRSPHEIDYSDVDGGVRGGAPYTEYIKRGLALMRECNAVILLRGWTGSTGARVEFDVSGRAITRFFYYDQGILMEMSK